MTMRARRLAVAVCTLSLLLLAAPDVMLRAAAAEPTRFYVALNGHDQWSGRLPDPNAAGTDGPFASFERARDAVRALKAKGLAAPVEVIIRGGTYFRSRMLELTPEDSGTARTAQQFASCPIVWRAQAGEKVIICGGQRITGWKPWHDGIYKADLKAQGLAGVSFHQLFYQAAATTDFARRQILARYPNFDPQHPRTGGNVYAAATAPKANEHIIYGAGDLPFDRWGDISQAEVVSTYNFGWMFAITPIRAVDTQTRTITVRRVRGRFLKFNRFFVQNFLAALDAPGEWFLDQKQSVLYFYPPNGNIANAEVIAPTIDNIIEVKGTIPYSFDYLNVAFKEPRDKSPMPKDAPPLNPVEHLTFRGLDFECARQDAIRMTGARDCQVVACRVANIGNIGIDLGGVTSSFAEVGNPRVTPATGRATGGAGGGGQILLLNDPCQDCRVFGCDVWSTGCEGIMLLGAGNLAENNHVWDIGLYAKDAPCINLLGEKNIARRNTLHDCPRCTIFIKGVDNVAELNDCHHACLETTDMGGIRLVQRNVFLKGNKIRFNRILDTVGYGFTAHEGTHYRSPFFTWGVYLDDYTSGTEVYGNIISRSGRGGVMIHGGGDNFVANNILYDTGSFGIEFAPMPENHPSYKGCYAGNRIERNIIVCTKPDTYPYRFTSATPSMPTFKNNLFWSGDAVPVFVTRGMVGVKGLPAWQQASGDNGSLVADPHLTKPGADDFLPRDDSPVWKLGFERIPVDQIGCYESPDRASWPITPNRDRFRETPVLHTAPGYTPTQEPLITVQLTGPVKEDYEADAVGRRPRHGDVLAPAPSQIVVTDECAAGGKHSLQFVDAPGLPQSWEPRIYYPLDFTSGTVTLSLDLRLDGKQPPDLYIDPRQYAGVAKGEYYSGPMLNVNTKGELSAAGTRLLTLPFDQWVHLRLDMTLGADAPDHSELTVTVAGQAPQHFTVSHVSRGFRQLQRVVISSLTNTRSVFYVDNLQIGPEQH